MLFVERRKFKCDCPFKLGSVDSAFGEVRLKINRRDICNVTGNNIGIS